jgi:3-methyladenine DNA glycosylase AlkD
MQAYMKSDMPFLGVPAPAVGRVAREQLAGLEDWRPAVLELWRGAEYREERYAALWLLRRHARDADLPLCEELVVTGAWWDHVDSVARVVGALLPGIADDVRRWARDGNLWKRRVSIICQLGRKGDTDLDLLTECVEANAADREFFVRKAIGWALRDYAWHDPRWVAAYVDAHPELSPLSRREATKNLARLLA